MAKKVRPKKVSKPKTPPYLKPLAAIVLLLLAGFVMFKTNDTSDFEPPQQPANNPSTVELTSPVTPASEAGNKAPTQSKPVAFKVSKVFFSKTPTLYGYSKVGIVCASRNDPYNFSAQADVTATAAGTVDFHWSEYQTDVVANDGTGKTVDQTSEKVAFDKAGTKTVRRDWSYTNPYTDNASHGYRLYINVVTDSPNKAYANQEQPVYPASSGANQPSFVWGTYADLCWN